MPVILAPGLNHWLSIILENILIETFMLRSLWFWSVLGSWLDQLKCSWRFIVICFIGSQIKMISDQFAESSLKCKPARLHPLVFTVGWESLEAVCNLHQFSYFYVSQIEPSACSISHCRLLGGGADISTGCCADTGGGNTDLVTASDNGKQWWSVGEISFRRDQVFRGYICFYY